MPGFQYQRVWDEKPLSDAIKTSLLSEPDERMIISTTSNVQMEPCCIVLLDHKYPLIGVTSVTVRRSRRNESNTASISLVNIGSRYSGPNKSKIAANVPVSIYMGYSKRYIQRFEGFIDTTSLTVNDTQSNITIECRDKAKKWIEDKDISCGIYSENSDYFGVGDWHYKLSADTPPIHLPRPWTHEEVIRDVCYELGLRDIVPYIYIEEKDMGNGFFDYARHINYEAEYKINIDPKWESDIVCNFVEENALDVLGKLAQSVFHEVFFDAQGKLVVRPVKTATDDAVFYYKEERDIIELSQNTNDDDVANIITITGQTADETAVIYPFCAVAQSDTITLEKGQDEYGYQLRYPKVVAKENIASLQRGSLYAHTIAPNAAPVAEPKDNPENKPSYDFLIHYPNFAQPYEKQVCLDASCPIITDEAEMADTNNIRTWNFYGEVDTAVAYENQPIILKDRFGKDVLVVCKERSMDDDSIKACGNIPFNPDSPDNEEDEDSVPVNIPTVFDHHRFTGGVGYNYLFEEDVPQGTSAYAGTLVGSGTYTLTGVKDFQDSNSQNRLPDSALGYIPSGLTQSSFDGKCFTISQFTVSKGKSPWPSVVADSVYDMVSLTNLLDCGAIVTVEQVVDVHKYVMGTSTYYAPANSGYIDPSSYTNPSVVNFTTNPSPLYQNCYMYNSSTLGGILQLSGSTYTSRDSIPSGASDAGFDHQVIIKYPLLFSTLGTGVSGSAYWSLRLIDADMLSVFSTIVTCTGTTMEVWVTTVDRRYMKNGDPDCNCIYWKWFGTFQKEGTPDNSASRKCPTKQDMSKQGEDAEGNPRRLISKEQFYKLAAEPHTVVIECLTSGIDHKSWAEVLDLSERQVIMKGHNLYGSMADEYREMLEAIEDYLHTIGWVLMILGTLGAIQIVWGAMGASFGPDITSLAFWAVVSTTVLEIIMGAVLAFKDIDTNVGQNVSKVMEDMTGRVTACRRPEIELYGAGWSQACQWYMREEDAKNPNGKLAPNPAALRYTPYSMFGYDENCTVDPVYTDAYRTKQNSELSRNHCWVYILDLRNPASAGGSFPEGAMLTAFGWETPEVGDRNPIQYYQGVDYHDDTDSPSYSYPTNPTHRVITTRYAIEAFADDPSDPTYTAERLLALRFENASWGIKPRANETWWDSRGYELLVDRSMTEVAVTDAGIWHDFWEKRDDYTDRRYKYVALIVYSWEDYMLGMDDTTPVGSRNVTGSPSMNIFCNQRWGLFVPRGLNLGWYNKFRWLERTTPALAAKKEQNYLSVKIISQGQELLIADLFNNFKYSTVQAIIRVWGKPYGTYAPTIVYYKEFATDSIYTYGRRQIDLQNNCINDFRTARRIANMLTAQSNETFSMQSTGKPYIYEGEVVMVKEENTGAIAGVFRDWENYWKSPDTKPCTEVANQLVLTQLEGVYQPQCATPTVGNNTLIACSDGTTKQTYLIEIDKACNPIWYCKGTTVTRPTFILRWEGIGGQYNANVTTYTIIGMADGTIQKIDYNIAQVVGTLTLPQVPLCGCMDEEQVIMFVGTQSAVYAIDLETFSIKFFSSTVGGAAGIACANWKVYDPRYEEDGYRELGVLFLLGSNGIACRQIYSDWNRTDFGGVLAFFNATGNPYGIPFERPGSLEFDKHTGELIYVNKSGSTHSASIWGLHVEVDLDPAHPELGITAGFDELRWKIDYMEDTALKQSFPVDSDRKLYIDKFFQPRHAIYDVNKSLLICDSEHNRVYKLNPSGKFYVTEVTDQFDISDDAATYKQTYDLVTVTAAGSLQLTNFGRNFMNTKTQEEITASISTTMGRIVEVRPRDKYMVKLLSSETVIEAINNSGVALSVKDTVIIMMGLGGDKSGVGTIIAKKALNDWTVETGKPYTYVDATTTSLEITKYGISAPESGGSGGSSNADLSAYNARIRTIEQRLRTLASLHNINW